ncbi:unnamed protein product [Rotaria sp. Silwood1]|nr:unnamed protein product [Rotaria sp. Silwood1]CAF1625746.1 unnamed protein product [Rotaria sp. Silwood1]CAF3757034.1 unnamed protein product [Rotaria sp. Silwood1]CAF3757507.1 unnamed protein product [Rotaria sp. Silwood1]CAF3788519.1 unnamed protein product [Rotaria sp. Silwood1]
MTDLASYAALLLTLNPIRGVHGVDINYGYPLISSQALYYNFGTAMSVSINPTRHMAIVGLPIENYVILLSINTTSLYYSEWTLNVTARYATVHNAIVGMGRSVVWLDNATVAITVLTVPDRPWSELEVWVYDIDKLSKGPLFAFPNNQQIISLGLPRFLHMLSWSGNLLILTDKDIVLFVPSTLAGFSSVWDIYPSSNNIIFNPTQCVAGTYKNTSNFGPCTVCPPQTKNPGKQPCTECELCAPTSFCPLGSVDDVSLDVYPSYTQTFSYPDSLDINNYDDLLVQNIFTIGYSRRCIVISPLFWTIIVIILCYIVWFLMTLPKRCKYSKGHSHRKRIKRFFKKTNIVNEGERWVGGLFSFGIIALFGFTCWFASEFLNLYPIETSGMSYVQCDDTVRNAVFESALQLPLPNPDGKQ